MIRFFLRQPIRSKLLIILTALNVLAVVTYTWQLYRVKSDSLINDLNSRLNIAAQAVPDMLASGYLEKVMRTHEVSSSDYQKVVHLLKGYAERTGLQSLYVLDRSSEKWVYLVHSGNRAFFSPYEYAPHTLEQAFQQKTILLDQREDALGHVRRLFLPIQQAKGSVYLIGAEIDQHLIDDAMNVLLIQSIFLGLLTFLGAFIFSWLISKVLTQPLLSLIEGIQQLEKGEYSKKIHLDTQDELGQLAQGINKMAEAVSLRETEILNLAYQDPLTQLANRVQLTDRLDREIQRGGKGAVLFLDINHFRHVNDCLGYQAGNQVLAQIARRFEPHIPHHALLARVGEDQYAIDYPDATLTDIETLNQTLNLALSQSPIEQKGHILEVSATAGVAFYPEHGGTGDILVGHAELAMYSAKQVHGRCAVYNPQHDAERLKQLALLTELRTAIEEDQLVIFYQPKLSMQTGEAIGVEALVRWNHPDRGWIPPGQFIPLAEETGRIRSITRWVLEKAVQQLLIWQTAGSLLSIAVNISTVDIQDDTFFSEVQTLLTNYPIDPTALCLEITESGMMQNPAQALKHLASLHGLNVRMSIDDFGTGYSSLSYLVRLPVHQLKIDRSFVIAMDDHDKAISIIRSTIELGHIMGLDVVAEGVENQAHLNVLASLGCDVAQGFYMAKPMPLEALEAWLAQHEPEKFAYSMPRFTTT